MNKFIKLLSVGCVGAMLVGFSSCRDDWSDQNTSPTQITKATPSTLLCSAEFAFYPFGYGHYFYGVRPTFINSQMASFSSGITEETLKNSVPSTSGCMVKALTYVSEMEYTLGQMSAEEAASYDAYLQAVKVIAIYCGIMDSDTSGDVPYTEGGRAYRGGTLTPQYDRVKDLYDLWNAELKNAVQVFKNPPAGQSGSASDDIIYGKDWNKWAKFASSLRVKLATRLLAQNAALAKQIVGEAVADGVITDSADDVLYNKSSARALDFVTGIDAGEIAYGSGNTSYDYHGICGNKKVVDWLRTNKDPRLRFQFEKNNWTGKVIQYYLSNGHKDVMPPVVLERCKIENGVFKGYKEEFGGNLWARYIGVPDMIDPVTGANLHNKENGQYFLYSQGAAEGGNQITVHVGESDATFSYRPFSYANEKLIRTNEDFTLPRIPGDNAERADYDTDTPRYDMYLSAAEINFYLAEFATYGGVAGLGSAAEYFKKAVEQSVNTWARLASLNKVQYYDQTYGYADEYEANIALQSGEVAALLARPDYQLTGNKSEDLEKIFLNLEIHFMFNTVDHFVTARRSGVPKIGSSILPRTTYTAVAATVMPRRPDFQKPSDTDQMRDILAEVYSRQGFTLNAAADFQAGLLNTERLWQDQGAPNWGAGPVVY